MWRHQTLTHTSRCKAIVKVIVICHWWLTLPREKSEWFQIVHLKNRSVVERQRPVERYEGATKMRCIQMWATRNSSQRQIYPTCMKTQTCRELWSKAEARVRNVFALFVIGTVIFTWVLSLLGCCFHGDLIEALTLMNIDNYDIVIAWKSFV